MAREYWEREDLLAHFSGDARRTLARVLDRLGELAGRAFWQERSGYWAFERAGGAHRIPVYLKLSHLSIDEELVGLLPDDLRDRLRSLEQTYPSIDFRDGFASRPGNGSTRTASATTAPRRPVLLLAWEPEAWGWREEDVWNAVAATENGETVEVQCSAAALGTGAEPGDPVYLVSREAGVEGIVAAGVTMGEVYSVADIDGHEPVDVVDVALDQILDPGQPLSLAGMAAAEPVALPATGGGQARMLDAERRKKVEDAAQDRLMQHYRDLGWTVEDTRFGNPFDARATKDGETVYLEAKGTTSAGRTVILTRGEVRHARTHRGSHVVGILSGIRFDAEGEIVQGSGSFRVLDLDPQDEDLDPIAFDWTVPR